MGDLVAAAAPIAGGFLGNMVAPGVGGAIGAQLGGALGGALAGGKSTQSANQNLQAAQQASQFRPIGITNTFGKTDYTYDDQGRLTDAGYSLSPQLQAYQDQLAGMTGQGLQASQNLMGLGMGYLGEDPNAVRQRYINEQTALLAPQQEQTLAGIRNNLFQTGRGGLATGATQAGGLAATNPEMAAYYNSLANTQRQIAAGADTAAQNQIKFGTGLLTGAYDPFKAGLGAQQGVENLGIGVLNMGTDLGKIAMGGAQAGADYLTRQRDPYSTGLSGLLGNEQLISGIGGIFSNAPSWTTGSDVIPQSTFSGSGDSFAFDDSWANPASSWNTGAINGLF